MLQCAKRLVLRVLPCVPAVFFALPAQADEVIERMPYDEISIPPGRQITFEDLSQHTERVLIIDDTLTLPDIRFAERFAGQETGGISMPDGARHDRVLGEPTAPLTLVPGRTGHNLAVAQNDPVFGSSVLLPSGPTPIAEGNMRRIHGEGAVAFLFDRDQCRVGVMVFLDRMRGYGPNTDRARLDLRFYDRRGVLLGAVQHTDEVGRQRFGYRYVGDPERGIAGVLIENLDHGGIALDDIRFSEECVPVMG